MCIRDSAKLQLNSLIHSPSSLATFKTPRQYKLSNIFKHDQPPQWCDPTHKFKQLTISLHWHITTMLRQSSIYNCIPISESASPVTHQDPRVHPRMNHALLPFVTPLCFLVFILFLFKFLSPCLLVFKERLQVI